MIVYLNDIRGFFKNFNQLHVDTGSQESEQLQKYSFHTNAKKCHLDKNEFFFLSSLISAYSIKIKEENIKPVKIQVASKLVRDIQVFLHFANFYYHLIKGLSKIGIPLIFLLRIIAIVYSLDSPLKTFKKSKQEAKNTNIEVTKIGNTKITKDTTSKNLTKFKIAKTILLETASEVKHFLTSKAKQAFTNLK